MKRKGWGLDLGGGGLEGLVVASRLCLYLANLSTRVAANPAESLSHSTHSTYTVLVTYVVSSSARPLPTPHMVVHDEHMYQPLLAHHQLFISVVTIPNGNAM